MRDRLASRCRALSALAGLLGPVFMAPSAGAGLGTWTSLGPAAGVLAVAVDPVTPTTIYAGTFRDGVFKTTDGGASWAATGLVSGSIATLAIDAITPATVYAGTFGAVYKTTDGGVSWVAKTSGLPTASAALVSALAIHPGTPTTVYAGTDPGGVFRSIDAGETWRQLTNPTVNEGAHALVIDPTTPTTLYVALHPRLAPGGAVYDGDGKEWFVFGSATGFAGPVPFGAPGLGDVPVPADYDGDGQADLAVFRQSTGEWFVRGSATGFGGPVPFGVPGDIPVPADYDGDGKADLAVYRASTGEWFIFGSATGFAGAVRFGAPVLGDIPVNRPVVLR